MDIAVCSRLEGDPRFLAATNQSGFERPLLWNPQTGERSDIDLPEVPGDLSPHDWSADGRFLLLSNLNRAEYSLYLYDFEKKSLRNLGVGTISGPAFCEDRIVMIHQNAERLPEIRSIGLGGGKTSLLLGTSAVPDGAAFESVAFSSADGTEIQAWLGTPEGDGPFPTIIHTHGGPSAVMTSTYSAAAQAWLDHGIAYMSINYRGSVTFGAEFQNAINGNLGDLEVQDVEAGVRWLTERGTADPKLIFKTGGSYGGYLTLQCLGKLPELWAGGMAVVAIADWNLMYEDQADTLRGFQRALFGGGPETKSEQYAISSPISYIENLKAPVLIIQGRNDTRCPARQMERYLEKAREAGKEIEIHWFDAGHGSLAKDEQIAHQQLMMEFVARVAADV